MDARSERVQATNYAWKAKYGGRRARRKKRNHGERAGQPLRTFASTNQEWAPDFVRSAEECRRAIRMLSVMDRVHAGVPGGGNEDQASRGQRAAHALEAIVAERGRLQSIRLWAGADEPEFSGLLHQA